MFLYKIYIYIKTFSGELVPTAGCLLKLLLDSVGGADWMTAGLSRLLIGPTQRRRRGLEAESETFYDSVSGGEERIYDITAGHGPIRQQLSLRSSNQRTDWFLMFFNSQKLEKLVCYLAKGM